jgi:hypothetical protein
MAYLDPGSGSYLLQLLLAALFGGLFVLRASWTRVSGFIRKMLGRDNESADDGDSE